MINVINFENGLLMEEVSKWEHSESDKGQIYTRPEVVEFMLTAMGLNSSEDLRDVRILEPSCGEGEFVIAIAKRLINIPKHKPSISQLMDRVLAIDLVGSSITIAKSKVRDLLSRNGYNQDEVIILIDNWFLTTDFLLEDIAPVFTHVVGNPPYVRVESIPKQLLADYRKRYSTMTDRADLYIPFFEKSLSLLKKGGKLSFICTDRWTKNTYGKALRQLISDKYSLELFIDLYGVDAFECEVMTYPAITQIAKSNRDHTILQLASSFTQSEAKDILHAINGKHSSIQARKGIVRESKPWLLGSSEHSALIHKIEEAFPTLEDAVCKVFIGAATGSNKVYIVDKEDVDIEESRLLPVITASELQTGLINWHGRYIVNTYDKNGVVDLDEYPKLAKYLNRHKEELCKRHVAKNDSCNWYKTIDRVYEERAKIEKLLIPDISDTPKVIYDKGIYHPNNSIYYVTSKEWNLHALRVVLLSNITKLFISSYSTKIAKGYLRFQAQHLRKIRIPYWDKIDDTLKAEMISASKTDNIEIFNKLTCEMYGFNKNDKSIIGV